MAVLSGRDPAITRVQRPAPARPPVSATDLAATTVAAVMHPGVVTVPPGDSLEHVAGTMADLRIHSVAVVGAGDGLSTERSYVAKVLPHAVLRELKPGEWKLSLRTGAEGRVNATEACRLLGGGGHAMAAGATVTGSLPEVKAKVLAAIDAVKAW